MIGCTSSRRNSDSWQSKLSKWRKKSSGILMLRWSLIKCLRMNWCIGLGIQRKRRRYSICIWVREKKYLRRLLKYTKIWKIISDIISFMNSKFGISQPSRKAYQRQIRWLTKYWPLNQVTNCKILKKKWQDSRNWD